MTASGKNRFVRARFENNILMLVPLHLSNLLGLRPTINNGPARLKLVASLLTDPCPEAFCLPPLLLNSLIRQNPRLTSLVLLLSIATLVPLTNLLASGL